MTIQFATNRHGLSTRFHHDKVQLDRFTPVFYPSKCLLSRVRKIIKVRTNDDGLDNNIDNNTTNQSTNESSFPAQPNRKKNEIHFFSCSIYIIHLVESSFYFSFVLSLAYQNGHTKQRRGWESFYQSNSVAVAYIVGYDGLGFFFFFSFLSFSSQNKSILNETLERLVFSIC